MTDDLLPGDSLPWDFISGAEQPRIGKPVVFRADAWNLDDYVTAMRDRTRQWNEEESA